MLDSKWGSSSGAGPCTTATGTSDDDEDGVGVGGSDVDVLLVVPFDPDPVVCEETVADAETAPTPRIEDDVVDTADATGSGGTGEGALCIRLGIRCSTDAASARAAIRCC